MHRTTKTKQHLLASSARKPKSTTNKLQASSLKLRSRLCNIKNSSEITSTSWFVQSSSKSPKFNVCWESTTAMIISFQVKIYVTWYEFSSSYSTRLRRTLGRVLDGSLGYLRGCYIFCRHISGKLKREQKCHFTRFSFNLRWREENKNSDKHPVLHSTGLFTQIRYFFYQDV